MLYHRFILPLIFILAACSPAASPPSAAPTTAPAVTTLTFGVANDRLPEYAPQIEQFEAQNPDIAIQTVALDTVVADTADAAQTLDAIARAADMSVIAAGLLVEAANAPQTLRDLTPLIDADSAFQRDDLYLAALPTGQNGAIRAIRRDVSIPLLFYNRDLFRQRGVAEPQADWTWEDVFDAAEQLAQTSGDTVETYGFLDSWGSLDNALAYALQEAGVTLDATTTLETLDQSATTAALERAAALVTSGAVYAPAPGDVTPTTSDVYVSLIREQRVGIWSNPFLDQPPEFEIGMMPRPQAAFTAPTGEASYVISSGSQHPEAAWRWLSFLSRQDIGAPQSTGLARAALAPARASIAEQRGYWQTLDTITGVAGAADVVRNALAAADGSRATFSARGVLAPLSAAVQSIAYEQVAAEQALALAQQTPAVSTDPQEPAPDSGATAAPVLLATPASAAVPESATVIRFKVPDFGRYDQIGRIAEKFNQQNPDMFVKVEVVANASAQSLAESSDCFTQHWSPSVYPIPGALDLQPLIDADAAFDVQDYPPALLAQFRQNGQLLGLPDQVKFLTLNYNRDLFDAAGLTYPDANWTLDDFLNAAQQLTRTDGSAPQYGYAENIIALFLFLDPFGVTPSLQTMRGDQWSLTDPKIIEASRIYLDLLTDYSPQRTIQYAWDGEAPEQADVDEPSTDQLIENGQVGMWFDLNNLYNADETATFTRAIVPPPGAGSLSVLNARVSGLYISTQTAYQQECWAWLKYLSGDLSRIQIRDQFPAQTSLAESDAFHQQAAPGLMEVYEAYKPALSREQPGQTIGTLTSTIPDIDAHWFLRALDRALRGADLERELADAELLTQQHLACYRATDRGPGDWRACATTIDPAYEGLALVLDAEEE